MLTADRNKIQSDKFILGILISEQDYHCTNDFSCGDADLDEFFQKDAYNHTKELLAQTYYFQPKGSDNTGNIIPIALISFLNDSILVRKSERDSIKKIIAEYLELILPDPKSNYSSFPAVKIGRLGIRKEFQRYGVGTALLNMVKEFFLTNNRTGCRFITVDAYNTEQAINFYKKNDFDFLIDKDKGTRTRIMYFDLMRYRL